MPRLEDASQPRAVGWVDRFGGLLESVATAGQVLEVLQRPYLASKLPPFYLDNVRRIFSKAELGTIAETVAACRDPSDDKFLELAVTGRAELIVTGDLDLLVLDPFRGISIVTPGAFGHSHARVT